MPKGYGFPHLPRGFMIEKILIGAIAFIAGFFLAIAFVDFVDFVDEDGDNGF